ncbi:EamA/RhaT family transporter [Streptomyces sp. NPDC048441]|uniref:EamA/RhaT family transporter n=1 Tax=Streptomyces sp. NPDC048441 TaxID=3365552 RepID=UPI0037240EDD
MSEDSSTPEATDATPPAVTGATPSAAAGATPPGPQPEPIRFFGTTWVDHRGGLTGYGARRAGVAAGSLLAAAAGCFVLRFAYEGMAVASVGTFVNFLVLIMFSICSAIAFRRTWEGFTRRHDPASQSSMRGLMTIGFVGALLAHFFRALTEAPGEKLHREEYEEACEQYAKRTSRRTGNPSRKKKRKP